MSLPDQLTNFVSKNGDTLQNMALLAYLRRGEEAQPFLEGVTAAKLAVDLYQRLNSKDDDLEAARQQVILNIAKFVKERPHARPAEVQQKVQEEVDAFAAKIRTRQI